jgi:outer membrane murein-binding lipoprotein Lpp
VQDDSPPLRMQTNGCGSAAVKSLVGAVPFAGSLLVEIAGIVIPNQRLDRVATFAQHLESKLRTLEQSFVRSQLTNENFTDLMEEGLRQAARSLSDERREHIATLISKSLDPSGMSYAESRHFLRVLGEIQ